MSNQIRIEYHLLDGRLFDSRLCTYIPRVADIIDFESGSYWVNHICWRGYDTSEPKIEIELDKCVEKKSSATAARIDKELTIEMLELIESAFEYCGGFEEFARRYFVDNDLDAWMQKAKSIRDE